MNFAIDSFLVTLKKQTSINVKNVNASVSDLSF